MGSNKGSPFEREIAVELSKWWTENEREDVFWRRDSGARAKTRSRQGKNTFGAHGDINAVDPIGLPLTNICTIELKVGYGKWSFLDILDRPKMKANQKNKTLQTFECFMQQVCEDAEAANTFPVLITKRDKRQKTIVIPIKLFKEIEEYYGRYNHFRIWISEDDEVPCPFYAINFEKFLDWCDPEFFITKSSDGSKHGSSENNNQRKRGKSKKAS